MGLLQNIIKKIKKIYTFENKLITELKDDHEKIFTIFMKIEKNFQKNNLKKIPELLKKFHYEYKLHIVYEDNYFYTYLKNKYNNDKPVLNFIDEKQKEMAVITRAINNFIKKYDNIEKINTSTFKKDLKKLGNMLYKRISFEESKLYTLYT
jgi:hemerythrin-like domain-containing protein